MPSGLMVDSARNEPTTSARPAAHCEMHLGAGGKARRGTKCEPFQDRRPAWELGREIRGGEATGSRTTGSAAHGEHPGVLSRRPDTSSMRVLRHLVSNSAPTLVGKPILRGPRWLGTFSTGSVAKSRRWWHGKDPRGSPGRFSATPPHRPPPGAQRISPKRPGRHGGPGVSSVASRCAERTSSLFRIRASNGLCSTETRDHSHGL